MKEQEKIAPGKPAEMKEVRLVLPLKRKWFLAIGRGEKTVEYRKFGYYWAVRLQRINPGDIIEFRLGYSAVNTIHAKFVGMDVGSCPYEGFDGDYYRIKFEVIEKGGFRKGGEA